MKKYRNRFFKGVIPVLTAVMMLLVSSAVVEAKTVKNPDQIITLYSASSKSYVENQRNYAAANEAVLNTEIFLGAKIDALKSSNNAVAGVLYKKGYAPISINTNETHKTAYLKAKKPGSTTVSFKCGNYTYKQKVIVKKYEAPFSSVKLNSTELASKFRTNASYTMSYNKYKNKKIKLSYKCKGSWTISGAKYLESPKKASYNWIKNKASFKVTKKNSALVLYMYNTKTRQSEQCLIMFK